MPTHLLSAVFEGGLKAPNYVNGRLLAAEDFRADRAATLSRLSWLGKAAGHGVIEGLNVEGGGTGLMVSAGLGINRAGYPISLPRSVTLSLRQLPTDTTTPVVQGEVEDESATPTDLGRFSLCNFLPETGVSSVPLGDYLLTVSPTSILEEQVPVKAAPGSTLPPACAAKWERDGLQFKAILLTRFAADIPDVEAATRRNRLAHWCYGGIDPQFGALGANPFAFGETYGGLDRLTSADLTPCDLPLAVFHWNGGSLTFVDRWSVRRRLIQPRALIDEWGGILGDRRVADGQARFLQFQDQLKGIPTSSSFAATTAFRFLPPAGLLPIDPTVLIKTVADLLDGLDIGEGKQPPIKYGEWITDLGIKYFNAIAKNRDPRTFDLQLAVKNPVKPATDPVVLQALDYTIAVSEQVSTLRAQIDELKVSLEAVKQPAGGDLIGLEAEASNDVDVGDIFAEAPDRPPATVTPSAADQERRINLEILGAWLDRLKANTAGFDLETFFGTEITRLGIVRRDVLDAAIQASWYDEPIDLQQETEQIAFLFEAVEVAPQDVSIPAINFYVVYETWFQSQNQPYVLFTRAVLPTIWSVDLTPKAPEP